MTIELPPFLGWVLAIILSFGVADFTVHLLDRFGLIGGTHPFAGSRPEIQGISRPLARPPPRPLPCPVCDQAVGTTEDCEMCRQVRVKRSAQAEKVDHPSCPHCGRQLGAPHPLCVQCGMPFGSNPDCLLCWHPDNERIEPEPEQPKTEAKQGGSERGPE